MFNINHGLSNHSPEVSQEDKWCEYLRVVLKEAHKFSSSKSTFSMPVICQGQCRSDSKANNTCLTDVESRETVSDFDGFIEILVDSLVKSIFLMLLCVEVLHSFEVEQTITGFLVVIIVGLLFRFETFGSPLS